MDIMYFHIVLMFKDPGAQAECLNVDVWLLVVKSLKVCICCILISYSQALNRINLLILLFQYYYFCLVSSVKLKSHVSIIRHTPSADPHIVGRTVSNPDMAETKKPKTSDRRPRHPVVVKPECYKRCPVLGPERYTTVCKDNVMISQAAR